MLYLLPWHVGGTFEGVDGWHKERDSFSLIKESQEMGTHMLWEDVPLGQECFGT